MYFANLLRSQKISIFRLSPSKHLKQDSKKQNNNLLKLLKHELRLNDLAAVPLWS